MKIKPMVNAGALYGSDLVHMLMSHKCKTVDDYAEKVFLPHMLEKLESVGRFDTIWIPYLSQATRQKRGSTCRVSVKLKSVPQLLQILERSSNWNKIKPNFSIFSPQILVLLQQKGNSDAPHLKTIVSTLHHINNVLDIALLKPE